MFPIKIDGASTMEELFASSEGFKLPGVGEMITGTVVNIGKNHIVLDMDNAAMGIIKGEEAQDSKNTIRNIKIGDSLKATILAHENNDGYVVLSLRQASQGETWSKFVESHTEGGKLFVTVKEANKGGLLIEEDGIRGFIPVSQLAPEHYPRVPGGNSARILEKLGSLVGQKLEVKVINMDESEGRMILSEREAQKEERSKVLSVLEVGKIIKGRVSGIVDFGIFVNYEGVEGLVHISEIDWGHVSNPSDYTQVGEEIEVMVIGVEGEKVSFSMKKLVPNPWIVTAKKYSLGDKVEGVVNKITDYGVFVKLEESIAGLVHVSELSDDDDNPIPSETVKFGEKVMCIIINIDNNKHELGLSMRTNPKKFMKDSLKTEEAKKKESDTVEKE